MMDLEWTPNLSQNYSIDKYFDSVQEIMSSLVYLGLSLVLFVIVYGISFTLMPMIFGSFFTLMDTTVAGCPTCYNAEWLAIYEENEDTVQYLVPLMPTMGIIIIVIKVLMVASARGRD